MSQNLTCRTGQLNPRILSLGSSQLEAEDSKPFSPRKLPQAGLILESLNCHLQIWGRAIKHTSVSMYPYCPSSQNAEGIETLFKLFWNPPLSFLPPISKRNSPCECQTFQGERLQNGAPELSCKDTCRENVLDCFVFLIT